MWHEQLSQLGARLHGDRASDLELAVKAVERIVPVSGRYREILLEFGGAIWFDKGARYKPDVRNPLTKKDGYNNCEILFGLGNGEHSIVQKAAQYAGELPVSFVPIGESPGGNLVCINGEGAVHLWDHESRRNDTAWRIAASMDQFLNRLKPDDSEGGCTEGIIESESFLDF